MAKRNKVTKKVTITRAKKVSTPKRRASQNGTSSMNAVAMGALSLGQSMADPFSKAACIPDAALGVGCFSVKQEIAMAAGATAGTCTALVMNPNFSQGYYVDTGTAAATTPTLAPATNWSQWSKIVTIGNLYKAYRPISMGVRGTFVGSTSTDQGVVVVGIAPTAYQIGSLNGLAISALCATLRSYKVLPLRAGFFLTWRPEDVVDQANFTQLNTAVSNLNVVTTFPSLVVVAYGVQTNAVCLQCEMIANYEGQFQDTTFLAGGLEDQPRKVAEVGWYEKASNIASSVEQMGPLFSAALTGYSRSGILGAIKNVGMTMGNGYTYPLTNSVSLNDNQFRRRAIENVL